MSPAGEATPPAPPASPPKDESVPAENAPSQATLARELADFLIELSIALHKHAMYPAGHPSLTPAADNVVARLDDLLHGRHQVSVGVAMEQLVIEGVATDPKNPVLSDLARRLHGHQLGAMSFTSGVTPREIRTFLAGVAADPNRTGEPLGSLAPEQRDFGAHISLYPVAYDRLQIVDDRLQDVSESSGASRFGQLWVGLAKVAMDDESIDEAERQRRSQDPSLVATAIKTHAASAAYDQVIVGYLLKIAEELKQANGIEAAALRNRMRKLIAALDADTLDRLLTMGGDTRQRQRFMLQAAQGFEVDSVLRLLNTAGVANGQTISDQMLRMLHKLAHHAEQAPGPRQRVAEAAVREQVTDLVHGWGLADPNPDEYSSALQGMAGAAPVALVSARQLYGAEPRRILEMALECDVTGQTVADAMQRLLLDEDAGWVFGALETANSEHLYGTLRSVFADKRFLTEFLQREPLDQAVLDQLLPLLGPDAVEAMLQALIHSPSRQIRRQLLDHLMAPGMDVADAAIAHLDDSRWYVQRNMLTILAGLERLPADFDAAPYLQHADARVRREAVRVMLREAATREKGIGHALADSDEHVVTIALATAATYGCPRGAVPLVVSRATRGPSNLRVAAIRVLGTVEDPTALTALLGMVQPTRKLFRWKHPPKTPEYLAALCAIRPHEANRRVRSVLALAGRRRDAEIVAAVREGSMPDA